MALQRTDDGPRSHPPDGNSACVRARVDPRWRRGGSRAMKHWLRTACSAAALLAVMTGTLAADSRDDEPRDTGAGNLIAVLRESPGANKLQESLTPFGKISAHAADGREFQF